MKTYLRVASTTAASLLLALLSLTAVDPAYSKDAPAKKAARVPPIPSVPDMPIPQSAFNIPSQPTEGRNPFFPESTVRVVVPKADKPNTLDTSSIVLNGITSPPRRTAMINGRTFETGEEGEVKLPAGGKMLIKVEEIKNESAIIDVGGQRRELRLRAGV